MPRLELEEDVKNVKRLLNKKAIGFLAAGLILIAIPVIGTTLAGTITINSGSAGVQFAQGSLTTATCDSDITVSATSTYSDNFYLKTITLSGINLVSGCEGKTLTVSAATTASPSIPGTISSGVTDIAFTIPATVGSASTLVTGLPAGITATAGMVNASGSAYKSATTAVPYDTTGSITLTVTTPTLLTSTVSKFLIQAS
jgi:hypothetical protein